MYCRYKQVPKELIKIQKRFMYSMGRFSKISMVLLSRLNIVFNCPLGFGDIWAKCFFLLTPNRKNWNEHYICNSHRQFGISDVRWKHSSDSLYSVVTAIRRACHFSFSILPTDSHYNCISLISWLLLARCCIYQLGKGSKTRVTGIVRKRGGTPPHSSNFFR